MPVWVVADNSGNPYRVRIAGSSPTPEEQKKIDEFLAGINAKIPAFKPAEVPEESSFLGELAKGIVREGYRGVSTVPLRFVGGIGDFLVGNEQPGGITRVAQDIDWGLDDLIGPARGAEDSWGNTIGSLAGTLGSILVPTTAASKLAYASKLDSAAKALKPGEKLAEQAVKAASTAATRARIGTEVGLGTAMGTADAQRRIEAYEAETGTKLDPDSRAIANLVGGALGSTAVFPLERIAAPLAKILRFVPDKEMPGVVQSLAERLKDAASVGTVGAAQNVVYGFGQDMLERGLYNPNMDPTQSVMQNLVTGGGLAGGFQFLLGRALNKRAGAAQSLKDDIQREEEANAQRQAQLESDAAKAAQDAKDAELAKMQSTIGAQQAAFSPAGTEENLAAAYGQQLDEQMRGERAAEAAQRRAEARAAITNPMEQFALGRDDNQYLGNLQRAAETRDKRAAQGAATIGQEISRLSPEFMYFSKTGEPNRFSVAQEKSGRWSVVGPDGQPSGERSGRDFKTYGTAEEATAVASQLQADTYKTEYQNYLREALRVNQERAQGVARDIYRQPPELPRAPDLINPANLSNQEALSLAGRRNRIGRDVDLYRTPPTRQELLDANFPAQRVLEIAGPAPEPPKPAPTSLEFSQVPDRRMTVEPVPSEFPRMAPEAPPRPTAPIRGSATPEAPRPPVDNFSTPGYALPDRTPTKRETQFQINRRKKLEAIAAKEKARKAAQEQASAPSMAEMRNARDNNLMAQEGFSPAAALDIPTDPDLPIAAQGAIRTNRGVGEGEVTFKTAKGSSYVAHSDGTTTRNKAYRPEHGAKEQGIQPRSERTVYVDSGDVSRLAPINDKHGYVVEGNTVSMVWKNPKTGKVGSSPTSSGVRFSDTPRVGMTPIEFWNSGDLGFSRVHFGNKITEVNAAGREAPAGRDGGASAGAAGEAPRTQPPGGKTSSTPPAAKGQDAPPKKAQQRQPIDSDHPAVKRLTERLNGMGLGRVSLAIRGWIDNDASVGGKYTRDSAVAAKGLIEIAASRLPPGLNNEQLYQQLARIMDHELVHYMKDANLFTGKEWEQLTNYARTTFVPGKQYTYLQQAEVRNRNADTPYDRRIEEAVANAVSDALSGKKGDAPASTTSLFNRVKTFFRRVYEWLSPNTGGREVIERIRSGEVGRRPERFQELKPGESVSRYSQESPVGSAIKSETSGSPNLDISVNLVTRDGGSIDWQNYLARQRYSAASDYLAGVIQKLPLIGTEAASARKMARDQASGVNFEEYYPFEGTRFDDFPEGSTPSPMEPGERAAYYADTITRKLANRMIGLARFTDLIKENGGSVMEAFDAYQKNDALVGKSIYEIRKNDENLYRPLISSLNDLGFSSDDVTNLSAAGKAAREYLASTKDPNDGVLGLYLYALHARERNAVMEVINQKPRPEIDESGNVVFEDGPDGNPRVRALPKDNLSGMENAEADSIIQYLENHPSFDRLSDANTLVRQIVDNTNDIRVEGELIPSNMNFAFMEGPMAEAFREAAARNPGLEYLGQTGYRNYVPLKGFADQLDDDNFSNAMKARGLQFLSRQDMRALGRRSTAAKIIEHVILQNEEAIIRKNYADVGRSFLTMIEENTKGDPESKLSKMIGDQARIVARAPLKRVLVDGKYRVEVDGKYVTADGAQVREIQDPEFRRRLSEPEYRFYAVRRYAPDPETGVARRDENGRKVGDIEEVIIEVPNDNLRRALKGATGSGSETTAMVLEHIAKGTRFLANTVTSWNPEFVVSNVARDISEAMISIGQYEMKDLPKDVGKHAMPSVRALWRMDPNTLSKFMTGKDISSGDLSNLSDSEKRYINLARDFLDDGGSIEFFGMRDLATKTSEISQSLTRPQNFTTGQKAMQQLQKLGDFVEAYNTTAENAVRMSIYIALREALEKRGVDSMKARQHAAYASKNMTANFNRGGEWKATMNALKIFYNASIQGTWSLATAAKTSPAVRKMILGIVGAGMFNDFLQGSLSERDEDGRRVYDKIPSWELESRLILMDFLGMTERGYISIPMPYGYSMFWNFGRNMGKMVRGEQDAATAMISGVGGVIGALNPISGSHSFLNFASPHVLQPVADLYRNRNFMDRPIYKEPTQYGVSAPASQLHWNNTTQTSQNIADFMNDITGGSLGVSGVIDISPDIIDYMAGFLTGSAGKFVMRIADGSYDLATGNMSEFDIKDVPVIRQLAGNVTTRTDTELYQSVRATVLQPYNAVKKAMESGDPKTANSLRQQYRDEIRLGPIFREADNARNRLTAEIRRIRESNIIPEERKSEMIKRIRDIIARHEIKALAAYNRVSNQ